MTPHPDLDDRLRTGLRAAARDLPPWDAARALAAGGPEGGPGADRARRASRGRHRRWGAAGLAAVAVAAAVAAVVALAGDDRPAAEVEIGPPAAESEGDPPAGSVVLTLDGIIRTFGPDGEPAGEVATGDRFLGVSSMVSDGEGGWVLCATPNGGDEPYPDGSGGTVMLPAIGEDRIYRIARDGTQVDLGPGMCFFHLLATEVAGRTVVLSAADGSPLQMIDIASGERTPVPIDDQRYLFGRLAAGGGRFASWVDGRLRQWDIATGQALPDAPVTLPAQVWHLTFSPDATTLAYVTGEQGSGQLDVVVLDMATGAELFRRTLPLEVTASQVAFDGDTVAVNAYETAGNRVGGVTHVVDIATGDEHTVDAEGLLP